MREGGRGDLMYSIYNIYIVGLTYKYIIRSYKRKLQFLDVTRRAESYL